MRWSSSGKKPIIPDKRIVKQILYSLRYINYHAEGREASDVMDLLETEMSKTIWNLAALDELPETPSSSSCARHCAKRFRTTTTR